MLLIGNVIVKIKYKIKMYIILNDYCFILPPNDWLEIMRLIIYSVIILLNWLLYVSLEVYTYKIPASST